MERSSCRNEHITRTKVEEEREERERERENLDIDGISDPDGAEAAEGGDHGWGARVL